jgi:hypothetical protein
MIMMVRSNRLNFIVTTYAVNVLYNQHSFDIWRPPSSKFMKAALSHTAQAHRAWASDPLPGPSQTVYHAT